MDAPNIQLHYSHRRCCICDVKRFCGRKFIWNNVRGWQLKTVDIRRTTDLISFDPPVLSLILADDEVEVVVFRNFDRKAGHWIKPVGGADDQWFPQRIPRCLDPDVPQVSSLLRIAGSDGPARVEYTCSMRSGRDPQELGVIEINWP
ncbi:hypothetical protein NKH95_26710 [Mesorhizobium sp. M0848]|uniref:hypothetical protein n=1 Tax=Mesorhizobium sp. M0848 TaxID=2957012 RepID=UPI00333C3F96